MILRYFAFKFQTLSRCPNSCEAGRERLEMRRARWAERTAQLPAAGCSCYSAGTHLCLAGFARTGQRWRLAWFLVWEKKNARFGRMASPPNQNRGPRERPSPRHTGTGRGCWLDSFTRALSQAPTSRTARPTPSTLRQPLVDKRNLSHHLQSRAVPY